VMFDHVYAEQTPPLAAQRAEFVDYHASFEGEK
jgi:2-oxoisovalerate dehydrogenase E1 component alpha subunit